MAPKLLLNLALPPSAPKAQGSLWPAPQRVGWCPQCPPQYQTGPGSSGAKIPSSPEVPRRRAKTEDSVEGSQALQKGANLQRSNKWGGGEGRKAAQLLPLPSCPAATLTPRPGVLHGTTHPREPAATAEQPAPLLRQLSRCPGGEPGGLRAGDDNGSCLSTAHTVPGSVLNPLRAFILAWQVPIARWEMGTWGWVAVGGGAGCRQLGKMALISANCFLLAAMAYDRYVDIRSPLQYHNMMSKKLGIQMITGAYSSYFKLEARCMKFMHSGGVPQSGLRPLTVQEPFGDIRLLA
ncbi:hypothetical protein QTO34_014394 [Cnephaeus nilssonii]|uniref:Uncharacterized protein n=1 Tax=Cnephaeus nilssonii TaxID=3371016 RepID=A0AA40I6A5_CNENI|nr:hypothetical protein QTO34_014394 [Eptesicus nilssonii]